jgi:hypothetical protein
MEQNHLLTTCGLYCGACLDYANGECPGCGVNCDCGACTACYHHQHCHIYQCAHAKGYQTCAECDDLPCTSLIEFAYDPIWRSHLPVIENLRRQQKIGVEAWLAEQAAFWQQTERLQRNHYASAEYSARYREYQQKKNLLSTED